MWDSLINLSKSEEDEIRQYCLWIIGTAIQNNPKAQHSVGLAIIATACYLTFVSVFSLQYLSYNPLPHLISGLTSENQQWSSATRSKAIYCISNALRHNVRAVQGFDSLGGWKMLAAALQGKNVEFHIRDTLALQY
jgi:hsp70-interacting protein